MRKNRSRLQKNSQNHVIEAQSIDHHFEISDELTPPLLDPEGTLAEGYIMHLKNEMEKRGN